MSITRLDGTRTHTLDSHLLNYFKYALLYSVAADLLIPTIQSFDKVLLLKKGGQTVYFGDLGHNAETLLSYFERNGGRRCEPTENPYVFVDFQTCYLAYRMTERSTC